MEKMSQFRQPIVTATGIFLGFMLNFTSSWLPNAFTRQIFKDAFVAISILLCIPLLVIVLFRILRMNYPTHSVDTYYKRTLKYFLIAVTIPFIAFLIIIIERFITNVI